MRAIRVVAIMLICVLAGLWLGRTYWRAPPVEVSSSAVERLADFTLPDLDDRPRSIMEWSGRPLVINFWATWCAPCRREMPLLQHLHDERGATGLQVIGVALDNRADVSRFVAGTGVTYPVLYGEIAASRVAESFGDAYIGLPLSAFIAPGGEIIAVWSGELQAADLWRLVGEMDAVASGQRSVAEARKRLSID